MKKYPHIEQFRTVIKRIQNQHDFQGLDENGDAIFEHHTLYPTMNFHGTVKLDGTNSAVGTHPDGSIYFQLRSRKITLNDDNLGFAKAMTEILTEQVRAILFKGGARLFFGEWCGQGIQKRCGISQVSKRFVIFDIACENNEGYNWVNNPCGLGYLFSLNDLLTLNDAGIWLIDQFSGFTITVDFNTPEVAANKLTEIVNFVEAQCPVAKAFGVNNGVGEGVVWKSSDTPDDTDLWFKTKGEKHQKQKVKPNKIEVDPIKLQSVADFVEFAVSESRLQQALEFVTSENHGFAEMQHIGQFLKWLNQDIARECRDDLEASNLTMKDVSKAISPQAVSWYKENF